MIIALTGLPQSGKDTFANILCNKLNEHLCKKITFTRRAFAYPIKNMVAALLNIPVSQFESGEFKAKQTTEEEFWYFYSSIHSDPSNLSNVSRWSYLEYKDKMENDPNFKLHKPTYREVLQIVGDLMRSFNKEIFTETVLKEYEPNKGLIITDLRYDDEYIKIKERCPKNVIIKITKEGVKADNNHSSNKGIDEKYVDYTIENTGNISDFEEKANAIANLVINDELLKVVNNCKEIAQKHNKVYLDLDFMYYNKEEIFEKLIKGETFKTSNFEIDVDVYKKFNYKVYQFSNDEGSFVEIK